MELESIEEGKVKNILIKEGEKDISVGAVLAIVEDGNSIQKEPESQNPVTKNIDIKSMKDIKTSDNNNITVREAIRDAMAEEMRLDDTIFVMGEEVAEYQDMKW